MFIATTNEASQRTQDYMKEELEQGNSDRGKGGVKGRVNAPGEKEGENEIFTVEKEENVPQKKSEKQGGGRESGMGSLRVKGESKSEETKRTLKPRQSHNLGFIEVFA